MDPQIKCLTVNVRGLKDNKKRREVFYWLRKQSHDVTFLQETHCHTKKQEYSWGKEWDGQSVWGLGTNNSKGVAILFNRKHVYDFTTIFKDPNGRLIITELRVDEHVFRLCNVYGPNIPNERIDFYENHVTNFLDSDSINVVGGDFNCTLNPIMDRLKTDVAKFIYNDQSSKTIENMMHRHDLEDVWRRRNPNKVEFTWKHQGKKQASRIDYWLIPRSLDNSITSSAIIDCPFSDHNAVSISIKTSDTKRGKGYWKMNYHVITSELFKEKFQKFWNDWKETTTLYEDIRTWWDLTKIKIKQLSIWCSKEIASKQQYELNEIEICLSKTELNDPEREKLNKEKAKIYEQKAHGALIRSRVNWYEKGETSSKYFHDLEKRRAKEKLWDGILDQHGNYQEGTKNVMKRQVQFYKELYGKGQTSEHCQSMFLSNIRKTLSQESKNNIERELNQSELDTAVQQLKKYKSPGPDGIISEFYQIYWPLIGPLFKRVVDKIYEDDEMSFMQYQALITLLYKKGIREDIVNWRPISLLNNDYKIITKVFSNRLKEVIHELINEDQRGCIRGRHSHDCIRILIDVIEDGIDQDSCILLLDQEKAFDRVDTEWMFLVLERMGFGEYFMKWLRIMYKRPNSAIITNGYISEFFNIERGVRQGDSLSAMLYILQAEPLSNEIRNSSDIKGITLKLSDELSVEHQITQYVDDTNIFLQNKSMIQPCLDIIDKFNLASGSKTNLSKTKCLGSEYVEDHQNIDMTQGPVKALGIPLGMNVQEREIWLPRITRIKSCLNVWKTRNLTYKGKVHLIKCYGISNVLYTIESIDPTENIVKEVNDSIWDFLWDGKSRGKVKREICVQNRQEGGLEMPDISSIITTRRVKFALNVLNRPDEKWSLAAQYYFKIFDMDYKLNNFLLNVTDSNRFLEQNIPNFYKNCIIHFQKFNRAKKQKITDKNDILSEILWHNHQIHFNKTPLNWKHWGRSGLLRVKDILTSEGEFKENHIRAHLRNKCNMIFELSMIKKAIPPEWIRILRSTPTQTTSNTPADDHDNNIWSEVLLKSNIEGKEIYQVLLLSKPICNKSKNYWERKFGINDTDWKPFFLNVFNNKLLPRKIHDFNWKIFYGCLPVESRLHTMRKSDGLCKLCNLDLENLEHLLYSCPKLKNIWEKNELYIKQLFDVEIKFDYKLVILGLNIKDAKIQVINMLISILKWKIWLRRNDYVFESKFSDIDTVWKTYKVMVLSHCKTLRYSKSVNKKIRGLRSCLDKIFEVQ